MTLTLSQILLYAGALSIVIATPGPVVVAILARSLSGGVRASVPLALGVVVGDVVWPLVAIFGLSAIVGLYADFMTILRYVGAAMFLWMGIGLIRNAGNSVGAADPSLKVKGWAGFSAGVLTIMSNPKAILFYMGVLPSFFDLSTLTTADIVVICTISGIIPLVGNLIWAAMMSRARAFINSPQALRKANLTAGVALLLVALAILLLA